MTGDTIVALSSGRPPAAVAIIRSSGPDAHRAALALCGVLPAVRVAKVRTLRDPASGEPLDRVLLLRFDAPDSATGEDIVEYQCHGGRAVVDAVLGALTSFAAVRVAEPGEFTRRALANGRIDLTEAEGLADLLEAETQSQRRAAMALAGGDLTRLVDEWQHRILALSAEGEAAIDYVGDEDETRVDTAALRVAAVDLADELDAWLARPRAETLRHGVRVVIAGPPNAGKSSLLNALAGENRAIVTEIAGTTRDSIEVPLAIDGVPLVLVDTAGLRDTDDLVEAIGVARARDETRRAEILLWLGDDADAPAHPALIQVRSKADVPGVHVGQGLAVSAMTGAGLGSLLAEITAAARGLLPVEGIVALNRRQAEAIEDASTLLRAVPADLLLLAESLRSVRITFDRLTGKAGVEDAIDALFSRFCLGK